MTEHNLPDAAADGYEWPPEAAAVITAELNACVLGERERPELRTDLPARYARTMRRIGLILSRALVRQTFRLPPGLPIGPAEAARIMAPRAHPELPPLD